MSEEIQKTDEKNNIQEGSVEQKEMVALLKKTLFFQKCIAMLLFVFVICICIIVPGILTTLNTAKTTMSSLNVTIGKMDTAIESITDLADNGSDGMQEALEKMNSIDIEKLNGAISDLSDVVAPMAEFFGRFK